MRDFHPGLPAARVDLELRSAVRSYRSAERLAVLWFADLNRRRLFRELGFGSIQLYAAERLGFSESKTAQFLRLCRNLEALPELQRSVAEGEVEWTKARAVAGVATPKTERQWVEKARTSSRRELEREVRRARDRGRSARRRNPAQGALLPADDSSPAAGPAAPASSECRGTGPERGTGAGRSCGSGHDGADVTEAAAAGPDVPVTVSFRLSPELYARYQAIVETLRKRGRRDSREALVVGALEALVTGGAQSIETPGGAVDPAPTDPGEEAGEAKPRSRVSSSTACAYPGTQRAARHPVYQVVVRYCPGCERGVVVAGREDRELTPDRMRAILCDARTRRPGGRNTAAIPPSVRARVLERDGYRCRTAGCRSARFLEVHHVAPRERGGGNDPENLVTLCSGCHAALHGMGEHRAHDPLTRTPAA